MSNAMRFQRTPLQQRADRDTRAAERAKSLPLRERSLSEERYAAILKDAVPALADVFAEVDDYHRHVTIFVEVARDYLPAVEDVAEEYRPGGYTLELFRVDAQQMKRARDTYRVPQPGPASCR